MVVCLLNKAQAWEREVPDCEYWLSRGGRGVQMQHTWQMCYAPLPWVQIPWIPFSVFDRSCNPEIRRSMTFCISSSCSDTRSSLQFRSVFSTVNHTYMHTWSRLAVGCRESFAACACFYTIGDFPAMTALAAVDDSPSVLKQYSVCHRLSFAALVVFDIFLMTFWCRHNRSGRSAVMYFYACS